MARITPFVATLDSFLRGQMQGEDITRQRKMQEDELKRMQEQQMYDRTMKEKLYGLEENKFRASEADAQAKALAQKEKDAYEMRKDSIGQLEDMEKRKQKYAEENAGMFGFSAGESLNLATKRINSETHGAYGKLRTELFGQQPTETSFQYNKDFATKEPIPEARQNWAVQQGLFAQEDKNRGYELDVFKAEETQRHNAAMEENARELRTIQENKARGVYTSEDEKREQYLRNKKLELETQKARVDLADAVRESLEDPELSYLDKETVKDLHMRIRATESDMSLDDETKRRRIVNFLEQLEEIDRNNGKTIFTKPVDLIMNMVIGGQGDIEVPETFGGPPISEGYFMPPEIVMPTGATRSTGTKKGTTTSSKGTGKKLVVPPVKVVPGLNSKTGKKSTENKKSTGKKSTGKKKGASGVEY